MAFKVLPLVWTDKPPPGYDDEDAGLFAPGLGGHYKIEPNGLLWMADDPFTWAQYTFEGEAKEAAQTDHEARVRAIIEGGE